MLTDATGLSFMPLSVPMALTVCAPLVPVLLVEELRKQIAKVADLHRKDLSAGPGELRRKFTMTASAAHVMLIFRIGATAMLAPEASIRPC